MSKLRKTITILLLCLLLYLPSQITLSQDITPLGTSSTTNSQASPPVSFRAAPLEVDVITFSEYSLGTHISTQYSDLGIIFGGDNPFISTDASNPTSPVLSGTPRFQGEIEGIFVNPVDGVTPTVVESFALDAGYFDELGSTRIEWFDPQGNKIGQRTNTQYGIERFTIEGGNIASWRMSIIENEPFGYAVDNIYLTSAEASLLFREMDETAKEGTWEGEGDEVPGFDHVGFHIDNRVYESHPGYGPDGARYGDVYTYYSAGGAEALNITTLNGVQQEHSRGTFEHDSRYPDSTEVEVFAEIPISYELALDMRDQIESEMGTAFQRIDFRSLEGIDRTLSPSAQKGGNGSYTCVGLVEWAAESAGHNGGQGFIRNVFESIPVSVEVEWGLPPSVDILELPLLSPEFLYWTMSYNQMLNGIDQWFQGIFDPVDFIITDPLGRRLGYTAQLGTINEIPYAFFTGDGDVEQFLIPNPVAGLYQIEFFGLNAPVLGAVGSNSDSWGINKTLTQGQMLHHTFYVEAVAGSPGDVNFDGVVNNGDVVAISNTLNRFTNDLLDPADINGDGLISNADLDLLLLLTATQVVEVSIDIVPNSNTNNINCNVPDDVITVAILTTSDFNALDVDHRTVRFEGAAEMHVANGVPARHETDVDGDGDRDLVLHFRVGDTNLHCGFTEGEITGETFDGQPIFGFDDLIIQRINNPPTPRNDNYSTFPGRAITVNVLANDTDVDGDTLRITAVAPALNGRTVLNTNNTITYTPNSNFIGVENVSYTVTDGTASSSATIVILVIREALPPTGIPPTSTPIVIPVNPTNVPPVIGVRNTAVPQEDTAQTEEVVADIITATATSTPIEYVDAMATLIVSSDMTQTAVALSATMIPTLTSTSDADVVMASEGTNVATLDTDLVLTEEPSTNADDASENNEVVDNNGRNTTLSEPTGILLLDASEITDASETIDVQVAVVLPSGSYTTDIVLCNESDAMLEFSELVLNNGHTISASNWEEAANCMSFTIAAWDNPAPNSRVELFTARYNIVKSGHILLNGSNTRITRISDMQPVELVTSYLIAGQQQSSKLLLGFVVAGMALLFSLMIFVVVKRRN